MIARITWLVPARDRRRELHDGILVLLSVDFMLRLHEAHMYGRSDG